MREDNRPSSKDVLRQQKMEARRKQVILNRSIFAGVLVILVLVISIFAVKVLRSDGAKEDNKVQNKPLNGNQQNIATEELTSEEETEETTQEETTRGSLYREDGKRIVVVDPGHGAHDPGSTASSGNYEKEDVLKLAKVLRTKLEAKGVTVILTREDDTFLELPKRAKVANDVDADLLLSLHRNEYASDSSVRGFEAWVHNSKPKESIDVATRIQKALVGVGISKDRGVKFGSQTDVNENYVVNSRSLGPSVLLEMGFTTNAADNAMFRNKINEMAEAMANAIVEWMDAQGL